MIGVIGPARRSDWECSSVFFKWLLDSRLVAGKGLPPKTVQIRAQPSQPVRVDPVDAARTDRLVDDQPGVLQHAQVLRHRRSTDRQLARKLDHRARAIQKQVEDRLPSRITKRGPGGSLVSWHQR
jgi:hypothetical protein